MEMKQIAVIAVVIVVIAAAVGVGWMMLSDGDDPERIEINAALEVYGNANGDDRIDEQDLEIIRDIIAGEKLFKDYRLADADNDKDVDNDDLVKVKAIMGATSADRVTVYHINHTTADTGDYVAETTYPILSAVSTGATNTLLVMKYLGIYSEIKGLSFGTNAPDKAFFYEFVSLIEGTNLGIIEGQSTSSLRMNSEVVSNLVTTKGVTACITADNRSYVTNESTLEEIGVDVVRIMPSAADAEEFISAMLMLAFLFDADSKGYMDRCLELIGWYEDYLTDVDNRLSNVKNKVSAVSSSSGGTVGTSISEYTNAIVAAGATYPLGGRDAGGSATEAFTSGAGNWLLNYDIDYVINIRTSPGTSSWYSGTVLTSASATVKGYITQFSDLECYENGNVYIISGDIPVMLRIAYAAEIMYPDTFGTGWADAKHLEFAKKFMGLTDAFMEGKKFVITMDDVGL